MMLFVIAGSIFGGLAFASLSEYLMHRVYLHSGKSNPHTEEHHRRFTGSSFSNPQADPAAIQSGWGYLALCVVLAILPAGLLTPFVSLPIFSLMVILYFVWSEYLHLLFHKPGHNWIESTKEFAYLRSRHERHHAVPSSDYGIGTSLWDKVLGSENRMTSPN